MRNPDWMEIGAVIGLTVAMGLMAPGPRLHVPAVSGPMPASASQTDAMTTAVSERTPESSAPTTREAGR